MLQHKYPRLLAGVLVLSLLANGWLLMENRRLLASIQVNDTYEPLRVHVVGAVVSPGMLEMPRGSRVADALHAAGGTLPTADISGLNLAKPLFDGEQISVLVALPATTSTGSAISVPTGSAQTGFVNINSAGEAELDTLPGIGPAKAVSIINYRQQNGAFAKPEDLMKVSGIGEKTFDKLKHLITVR